MIPSPSVGMRSISKNGSRRRKSTGTIRSEDHKHNSDTGRPVSQQVCVGTSLLHRDVLGQAYTLNEVGSHTNTDNSKTRNLSQAVQLHDLIRFVPSDAEATSQTGTVSPEKITSERDADHSQPTVLVSLDQWAYHLLRLKIGPMAWLSYTRISSEYYSTRTNRARTCRLGSIV